MTSIHAVVPEGIDDPSRPSGGNAYDRRVLDGLRATGWSVHEHAVRGSWPQPGAAALTALDSVVSCVPAGAVLLVDGLVASGACQVLVPAAGRLHLVVLVHLPSGPREVLAAASAVLTTSRWSRSVLLERHDLCPARVHVAEPGVETSALVPGTRSGGALLCVAAVTRHKGHQTLLRALAQLTDLSWRCDMVGSVSREPGCADRVRRQVHRNGLSGHVTFRGPLHGEALAAAYASADLLVLPTRRESYGMVVTEALARGLPVLATAVGGVPEAMGVLPDGRRPGLLVPPDDPTSLAVALRGWLTDPRLRAALRDAARVRRGALAGWSTTTGLVAGVLADVLAGVTA